MSEIRIRRKQDPQKEYAQYCEAVQHYHRYDVYLDELTGNDKKDRHLIYQRARKQLIILAGMNEDEYRQLQDSFKNHVIQKKIDLSEQYSQLKEIAEKTPDGKIYAYCAERVQDDFCSCLSVFAYSELDQARMICHQAFHDRKDSSETIQLSEGMFNCEGNIAACGELTAIIDTWEERGRIL